MHDEFEIKTQDAATEEFMLHMGHNPKKYSQKLLKNLQRVYFRTCLYCFRMLPLGKLTPF